MQGRAGSPCDQEHFDRAQLLLEQKVQAWSYVPGLFMAPQASTGHQEVLLYVTIHPAVLLIAPLAQDGGKAIVDHRGNLVEVRYCTY